MNIFSASLAALGPVKRLNLYINSDGGSVFEGIAIYEYIRRHPAFVTAYVDGLAASIASVITLAADEIVMASNAMMMIHDPWINISGSGDELRKSADVIDKVRKQILDIYVRRTGSDPETISALMQDETWLDAAEAIALGFADRIAEPQQVAASYDLSQFRNPPHHLARHYGVDIWKRSPGRDRLVTRAKAAYCRRQVLAMLASEIRASRQTRSTTWKTQ